MDVHGSAPVGQRIAVGIRRTVSGFQVYARVKGKFVSSHHPPDATLKALKDARKDLIAHARVGLARQPDETPLEDDIETYLSLVSGMRSFADRAFHLRLWAREFAGRTRHSLTATDIRAILERWRGAGRHDGKGLSAGSLNRRRTALMAFYTAMNGKGAANPVRDVPTYDEAASVQIRAIEPRLALRLIARVGRKKWGRPPSKTRARLYVMFWTGWPQATIMRLEPDDLDLAHGRVFIRARRKGKGTAGRWLPILPGAVHALEQFVAAKAFGPFSTSAMHTSFAHALARENQRRVTLKLPVVAAHPYSLRHTFGTELAKRTKDERAIQTLMLHASPAMTRRYTEGATDPRVAAALQLLQPSSEHSGEIRRNSRSGRKAGSAPQTRRKSSKSLGK